MVSLKRFTASSVFQEIMGTIGAWYLRFVWFTSRPVVEPGAMTIYEMAEMPVIIAAWHGQHFLMPFIKDARPHRAKVLISRHRDGESMRAPRRSSASARSAARARTTANSTEKAARPRSMRCSKRSRMVTMSQ